VLFIDRISRLKRNMYVKKRKKALKFELEVENEEKQRSSKLGTSL
jgi:hypothetical protein